jgi:hypothetical protein
MRDSKPLLKKVTQGNLSTTLKRISYRKRPLSINRLHGEMELG